MGGLPLQCRAVKRGHRFVCSLDFPRTWVGNDDFALKTSVPILLPVPEETAEALTVHGWTQRKLLYVALNRAKRGAMLLKLA